MIMSEIRLEPNAAPITVELELGQCEVVVVTGVRERCTVVLQPEAESGAEFVVDEDAEFVSPADHEAKYGVSYAVNGDKGEVRTVRKKDHPDQFIAFNTGETKGDRRFSIKVNESGKVTLYAMAGSMEVPQALKGKLFFPLGSDHDRRLVDDHVFADYNSPWGNPAEFIYMDGSPGLPDPDSTQSDKYDRYAHKGTDFLTEEGAPVYAVADGTVKKVSGDERWGYCVVVEHEVNDFVFTATYEHLQNEGRPKVGDNVKKEDRIGSIIKLNEPGEKVHLHFSMHEGDYRSSKKDEDGNLTHELYSNKGAVPISKIKEGDFFNAGNDALYEKVEEVV